MVLCVSWWFLVVLFDSWGFLVVLCDSWHFLVLYGGFLWFNCGVLLFLVILGVFGSC